MKVKEKIAKHIAEFDQDNRFPLIPQRVVSLVREALPDDGMVTLDNGMYKIWFARQYQTRHRNTLLLDNALATMGAGLPSAMGAKYTYPDRKVIAVCGDGGFMMNSQDLETAIREKLHIVVLILNDNGYGMIKWKQEGMGFENFGLEFGNPDFVKYAESYGAKGYRVESADHLRELLQKCLAEPAVHVIEVPLDYSENSRVLTKELGEIDCDII